MTLLVLTFLNDISIQYARYHFIDIHHSSISQYHPIISYTNSQQYLFADRVIPHHNCVDLDQTYISILHIIFFSNAIHVHITCSYYSIYK